MYHFGVLTSLCIILWVSVPGMFGQSWRSYNPAPSRYPSGRSHLDYWPYNYRYGDAHPGTVKTDHETQPRAEEKTNSVSSSYGRQPRKNVCSSELPCYDYTLTYILDGGPCTIDRVTEKEVLDAYAYAAGYTRAQVLEEARKATVFFYEKYGVDFRHISPSRILQSGVQSPDGVARLDMVKLSNKCRSRFLSATAGNKVQFFNTPIKDTAFSMTFNEEFNSKGNLKEVIPKGAFTLYGFYLLQQCPEDNPHHPGCRESVLTPSNPGAKLFIRVLSNVYLKPDNSPNSHFFVDCLVENVYLGKGNSRGYWATRPQTSSNDPFVYDGNTVMKFPGTLPV